MAEYVVQTISRAGITPTFAAVASSDTFKCPSDLRNYLEVLNGSGSSINVTIAAVQTTVDTAVAGTVGVDDIVVAVAQTTGRKKIGPFPPAYINAGSVTVAYSATTTVTAGAFRLPGR